MNNAFLSIITAPFIWFYNSLIGPVGPAKIIILALITIAYSFLQLIIFAFVGANYRNKKWRIYENQNSNWPLCPDTHKTFKKYLKQDSYYCLLCCLKYALHAITAALYAFIIHLSLNRILTDVLADDLPLTTIIWAVGIIASIAMPFLLWFIAGALVDFGYEVVHNHEKTERDFSYYNKRY